MQNALNLTADFTGFQQEQFDHEWGVWEANHRNEPKPQSRHIRIGDYELQNISDEQYDGRQYIPHSEIPQFARILGHTTSQEEYERRLDEEYQQCIRLGS